MMPLGTEVGFRPDDNMLDGAHLPHPKRGTLLNFRPMSIVANGRSFELLLSSC